MKIEILGTGCPKCNMLYQNILVALNKANKTAEIVKVEEIDKIIKYAVMTTPALVIDGQVKSAGKILSPEEITKFL